MRPSRRSFQAAGPRVVLVTGASSGIGRAVAHAAARRGDHLVLAARARPPLDETATECRVLGAGWVIVAPTDVADDGAVADLVRGAVAEHGRLDAVVHCAGVVAYGRAEDVPPEVFDGVLTTNVLGSMNVARHVIPLLRAQRAGSLVLTGSVIGHLAVPRMTAYVVSKWGVRALARQLQIENRDIPGVHVSYVAPGGVPTPIYEQAANYSGWAGRPPPPVSSPEHVAEVILQRLDHPRLRTQVGLANGFMRFGFAFLPSVFDLLVGPLFALLATDRSAPLAPQPGNVLVPRPSGDRLHGRPARPWRRVAGNLAAVVAGR